LAVLLDILIEEFRGFCHPFQHNMAIRTFLKYANFAYFQVHSYL
jgi:hypothetical protein